MPRRAAAITQADVARAIRAAKAEGWAGVRITVRDGTATIDILPAGPDRDAQKPVEQKGVPVL